MKIDIEKIKKFAENAKKDEVFMSYYREFLVYAKKQTQVIEQAAQELKQLKNKAPAKIIQDSKSIEKKINNFSEKITSWSEKYKDNTYVQELQTFYKFGNKKHAPYLPLDRIKKISIAVDKYLTEKGASDQIQDKKENQPSHIRKIIKSLIQKKVPEAIQQGQSLSLEDQQALKTIYKCYERIGKVEEKKIFFKSNIKKLVSDPNTLRKLCGYEKKQLSDTEWYSDDHMRWIGQDVLKNYCNVHTHEYIERLTIEDIDQDFIKQITQSNKPNFISCHIQNNHWIALCILPSTDQQPSYTILCKDSMGSYHASFTLAALQQAFQKNFQSVGIPLTENHWHMHPGIEQTNAYDCGPMALENLKIMAKILHTQNQKGLLDNFYDIHFCTDRQARIARKKHSTILKNKIQQNKIIFKNICSEVEQVFLESEEKWSKNQNITSYTDTLNSELASLKKVFTFFPHYEAAHQLKSKILYSLAEKHFQLSQYQAAYVYVEDLVNHYHDSSYEALRKNIIDHLPITPEQTQAVAERMDMLQHMNPDAKMDWNNLKEKLKEVNQLIPTHQAYTKDDIRSWAKKVKGKQITSAILPKYIAIINRANNIDTYENGGVGHTLRDTQILALLSFFYTKDNGMLQQVKTGEGKTIIVAALAILKVLEGNKVDILTSSGILAKRDAQAKQSLYEILGLTVADNGLDLQYVRGEKECYQADILYGSISDFQFDLLKHEHQLLETRGRDAKARPFDVVIVDEADSMLVDNGGHLAKLSGPLPGMEYLLPILLLVWTKVNKILPHLSFLLSFSNKKLYDLSSYTKIKKDISQEVKSSIDKGHIFPEIGKKSLIDPTKDLPDPTQFSFPKHLAHYATIKQIEKWVDNALKAALLFSKNKEYTLEQKSGEWIIAPVDASNTGTVQKGMIWSDGLHQFLQLKHGLRLTPESCNTSYISNLGYVKRYITKENNDPSIFGLTGTLGGKKERLLLSKSYDGLHFLYMPTFQKKKFTKEPTIYKASEEAWLDTIVQDTLSKAKKRAILLICATIAEAKLIYEHLKIAQAYTQQTSQIKLYLKDDQSNVTEQNMDIGDILVATNLAGRGTDIKLTKDLIKNGGMHLCLTFLPSNQRVEDQALGRTARQGKPGTGQLIIKKNDWIKELETYVVDYYKKNKLKYAPDQMIHYIEVARNTVEDQRMDQIMHTRLQQINLADDLFNQFSDLLKDLKTDHQNINWFYIVAKSIEERWGFWLKEQGIDQRKSLTSEEVETVQKDFIKFKKSITEEFSGENDKKGALAVIQNPFYLIDIGGYCMRKRDFVFAQQALEKAIALDDQPFIVAGAYYLLAFVAIEKGKAAENILLKACAALSDYLDWQDYEERSQVISVAADHLAKAAKANQVLQDFYVIFFNVCSTFPLNCSQGTISDNLTPILQLLQPLCVLSVHTAPADVKHTLTQYVESIRKQYNLSNEIIEELKQTLVTLYTRTKEKNSQKIFIQAITSTLQYIENNANQDKLTTPVLLTQWNSKITLLQLYSIYIKGNRDMIESLESEEGYLAIHAIITLNTQAIDLGGSQDVSHIKDQAKKAAAVKQIQEIQKTENFFKQTIHFHDFSAIGEIGFRDIFKIKIVGDIPKEKTHYVNLQIKIGLGCYTTAMFFPPCAPVMCPIGSTALSEGITDCINNLIDVFTKGEIVWNEATKEQYLKQKAKSIVIALAKVGIGALLRLAGVIKEGIEICQKISKKLRSVTGKFSKVGESLADWVDKFGSKLISLLEESNQFRKHLDSNLLYGLSDTLVDTILMKTNFQQLGIGNIQSYISVASIWKQGVNQKNIYKIAEALPDTGIEWLDTIKKFAPCMKQFQKGIANINWPDLIQSLPKNTGIPELDKITKTIKCFDKVQLGLQKGIQNNDLTVMIESLPKDTGIFELDTFAQNLIVINQVRLGVKEGIEKSDLTKLIEKLPKDTHIPEINAFVQNLTKVNNIRLNIKNVFDSDPNNPSIGDNTFTKLVDAMQDTGFKEIDQFTKNIKVFDTVRLGLKESIENNDLTKIIDNLPKDTHIPELNIFVENLSTINEVRLKLQPALEQGDLTELINALPKDTHIPEFNAFAKNLSTINDIRLKLQPALEQGDLTELINALPKDTHIPEFNAFAQNLKIIHHIFTVLVTIIEAKNGKKVDLNIIMQKLPKDTGIPIMNACINALQQLHEIQLVLYKEIDTKVLINRLNKIPVLGIQLLKMYRQFLIEKII